MSVFTVHCSSNAVQKKGPGCGCLDDFAGKMWFKQLWLLLVQQPTWRDAVKKGLNSCCVVCVSRLLTSCTVVGLGFFYIVLDFTPHVIASLQLHSLTVCKWRNNSQHCSNENSFSNFWEKVHSIWAELKAADNLLSNWIFILFSSDKSVNAAAAKLCSALFSIRGLSYLCSF